MPELPDVELYVECLREQLVGVRLSALTPTSAFVLRTAEPSCDALEGLRLERVDRVGKRIVLGFENELFASIHLMISGRLHYRAKGPGPKRSKNLLAVWSFDDGQLLWLSEVAKKKRAAIHLGQGESARKALDPGGLEILESNAEQFTQRLRAHSHTLKRALTDPRIFSGVGNAYSDEILHHAGMSPFLRTTKISDDAAAKLYESCVHVLEDWRIRLRKRMRGKFPTKVTAFHEDMAVHGRHGQPCPSCEAPVQRIVHGEREMNYCAPCQTKGKLLADRALSKLLREDWPKTLEELEDHLAERRVGDG